MKYSPLQKIGASFGIAGGLAFIGFIIAACYGWIMNIVKLVALPSDFTIELVARIFGIFFAPLGAVLGFV